MKRTEGSPSQEESAMLVLTRKRGEQIVIDGRIVVTLLDTRDGRARLGIKAPQATAAT